MGRIRLPHLLTLGAILAASASAQAPAATLVLNDDTIGAFPSGVSTRLVPWHACTLRLFGNPGERTALFLSTTWPPLATTFMGVPVGVDLGNLVVLWNGAVDPSAPVIGPNGVLDLPFTVPEPVPVGDYVHVQAVRFLAGGQILPSLALDLRWSGEPLATIANGILSLHPLGSTAGGGLVTVIDAPSWAAFWILHAGPGSPAPAVDFGTSFVIARYLGPFPTPGVSVQITDAWLDSAVTLHVYTQQGFGGPPPPPIPSQPFSIVRAPRSILSTQVQEHLSTVYYP